MTNNFNQEEIKKTLLAGASRIITTLCEDELPGNAADDSFRPDRHLHRELLFILYGESQFMLNNKIYRACPGTAFLLNKWESHSYGYRAGDRDLVHLWMHFNNDQLSGAMLRVSLGGQFRNLGKRIRFSDDLYLFVRRRWDMLEQFKDCPAETKDLLMRAPLNAVLEEYAMFQFELVDFPAEKSDDISVFLRNYIKTHNGRDCSLEQLEKLSGYSRFYLSRLFRENMGKTIGDYISEVRMQFVLEARKRGLKQKEIAGELGFSSPAAFWYWFNRTRK